ncbi:RHS repeat-associated core domain-containing protein [Sorangium sp. So ce1014]|uniref:RHS repeat-associated core domain-containing protein n=1 Tax=Sorangium sp. So ce1014 TaxID=3133326 RepID=UPI003F5D5E89
MAGAAPERLHYEPFGRRIEADGSAWAGSWGALTLGFAGVEQARMELIQMGGRAYDPAQRRFLSPDPLVSDPYFDQARHRYSYAHNNPATITDPTGYSPTGQWGAVPPAWLCGYVSPLQLSFGSYAGGGPMSTLQVRTGLPDVTPDSYRTATPAGPQFTGAGYAGGDVVARALIDHGVDAWLQENGDAAINVSLGVSYAALTLATYGMAAEAGVFAGMSARVASFGATLWRAITGVAGVVGEGARRYGNQVTRWGAQVMRGAGGGADAAASSVARATGAFNPGAQGGAGLGKLAERSIQVSERGLAIVENHLARFEPVPQNVAMVGRLRSALASGQRVVGADASFYLHEVSEATRMGRGLAYDVAHAGALAKYGVSPFSVYHPDVILANPGSFNSNWFKFWGLQ